MQLLRVISFEFTKVHLVNIYSLNMYLYEIKHLRNTNWKLSTLLTRGIFNGLLACLICTLFIALKWKSEGRIII